MLSGRLGLVALVAVVDRGKVRPLREAAIDSCILRMMWLVEIVHIKSVRGSDSRFKN